MRSEIVLKYGRTYDSSRTMRTLIYLPFATSTSHRLPLAKLRGDLYPGIRYSDHYGITDLATRTHSFIQSTTKYSATRTIKSTCPTKHHLRHLSLRHRATPLAVRNFWQRLSIIQGSPRLIQHRFDPSCVHMINT